MGHYYNRSRVPLAVRFGDGESASFPGKRYTQIPDKYDGDGGVRRNVEKGLLVKVPAKAAGIYEAPTPAVPPAVPELPPELPSPPPPEPVVEEVLPFAGSPEEPRVEKKRRDR